MVGEEVVALAVSSAVELELLIDDLSVQLTVMMMVSNLCPFLGWSLKALKCPP